jgi:hypothetical protein
MLSGGTREKVAANQLSRRGPAGVLVDELDHALEIDVHHPVGGAQHHRVEERGMLDRPLLGDLAVRVRAGEREHVADLRGDAARERGPVTLIEIATA